VKTLTIKHEEKIKNFYSKRYKLVGNKIQSVGWNSKTNQYLRFKILLKNINLKNKTILDYGCGFADLLLYLQKMKKYSFSYSGYDVVKSFVSFNKSRFIGFKFYYNESFLNENKYDYILCSGVFSLNSGLKKKYLKKKSLFLLNKCRKGLLINFLSKKTKNKLSKNLYYSVKEIKDQFKDIKNIKIKIIKSYGLNEFTIQLIKI
jgi:ubiquinone/menaquinone biosynthesis C-methylase UbiE